MAAYLQLGHESWNLLDDEGLSAYEGVVVSPVNDTPDKVVERLEAMDNRGAIEVILDPQLYNPASEKGQLATWPYFPMDFETADRSDTQWWSYRARAVVENAKSIGADAACSPAFLPKVFSNEYYEFIAAISNSMKAEGDSNEIDVLLTAIVPMKDLADPKKASAIASILSSSDCDRIYLIFWDETGSRGPFKDSEALPTAVHLIKLLSAQMRVQVAFCGHDLVLWKFAGAQDVTSGKWLNVRRFSPARWNDEETQGRQVSYWNDTGLITLLREADVLMLDRQGWYKGETFSANPFSAQIIEILRSGSGAAWQALSWRQYLRWVANVDAGLKTPKDALDYLSRADKRWAEFEAMKLLMQDRPNDGSWIRLWINACNEGARR